MTGTLKHCISHRVRYSETDRMGIAYYSRYLEWFEMGRTEMLRAVGFPYAELEKSGILLPVIEAHLRLHRPVLYDEEITIRTFITGRSKAKITINCEIVADGTIRAEGYTVHVFANRDLKPIRPPRNIVSELKKAFMVEGVDHQE